MWSMKPTVLRLNTPLLSPLKAHFASTTLSVYTTGLKFVLKNTEQLHQTDHSKSVFHHWFRDWKTIIQIQILNPPHHH